MKMLFILAIAPAKVETFIAPTSGDVHSWYDISKDFFLPIIIAIIAVAGAYFIFYRETRRDRFKDETAQKQRVYDKLTYFATLISNILKTSKDQNVYVQEWADATRTNPLEFPLLTYMPMKDSQRLTQIDVESYLLAYADHFNEDRRNSIKNFKRIMVNTDFIYHMFQAIFDQVKKGQEFDFERKTQYQELYYKSYNACGTFMMSLAKYPDWKNRLETIFDQFQAQHTGNNYNLEFYYVHYFEPLNQFCTDYATAGLPLDSLFEQIAFSTRDGKQLYAHIETQNLALADDFQEDVKKVNSSLEEISELFIALKKEFIG